MSELDAPPAIEGRQGQAQVQEDQRKKKGTGINKRETRGFLVLITMEPPPRLPALPQYYDRYMPIVGGTVKKKRVNLVCIRIPHPCPSTAGLGFRFYC